MEQNNLHIDPIELISKILAGEATNQEQAQFDAWIAESIDNKALFNEFKQVWEGVEPKADNSIDIDAEWNHLEKRILQTSNVVDMKTKNRFGLLLKIAAVAVIVVISVISVGLFTNKITLNQIAGVIPIEFKGTGYSDELTANTKVLTEQLADGSTITLNKHAKLSYSKVFDGKTRAVKLNGEAFFEVAPDKAKPFIIDAGSVYVKVLGTSFMVDAEDASDSVVVVVTTGKVEVTDKNNTDNQVVLMPGERAVFLKSTGSLIKNENKDANYISWKTGEIVFNDTRLTQIVRLLNKVYQEKIVITNDEIKNCRVTASFSNQSLPSVLNIISTTLNAVVVKKGEVYEISGNGCK